MKIRKATKKDIKDIAKLSLEYAKYENKLNKEIKIRSLKEIEKEEKNWVKLGTKYILAKEGKETFGVLSFNIDKRGKEKIGVLHTTIIKENLRGKGVGKALVNYALNYFKKNDCRRVKTFIHIKNKKAFKFWTKQGFETEEGYNAEKKLK
jgi:N-acetylglutamate synthase-like GNAT family acetyltransferase